MFGHPLHPALVHFPIGLLLSASIIDAAWLAGFTSGTQVGAVMMGGGLVAGVLAMAAGMIDFARLEQAVVPHAVRHMLTVGLAWIGYGVALYLRRDIFAGETAIPLTSIAASLISAVVLALGGWLGGRLVYTFGAGVRKPH